MNLRSALELMSQLTDAEARALRDALHDASSSALMELMTTDADIPAAESRRLVSGRLSQAIQRDLQG